MKLKGPDQRNVCVTHVFVFRLGLAVLVSAPLPLFATEMGVSTPSKPSATLKDSQVKTPKAWLGISFQDLPAAQVPREYGAVSPAGVVRVLQVFKNTSADQAGLQVDDILLAINEAPMQGRTTLLDSVSHRKVGETVRLKIGRAGKTFSQKMALSPRPEDLTAITQTLIGSPAPALDGQYYQGTPGTLQQLKGKVILVDFWATWCGPCRMTLPELDAVYQNYKAKGLVVIGVSSETRAELQAFQAQSPVSYPLFHDIAQLSTRKFQAFAYPTLVLIDKQGLVQRVEVGTHDRESIGSWVKELL